ncbi:MAG TPA: prolyl oligopeptidase family serine peptidase [Polyangiaceae bacterium]|nr:prolyl oligopeptidase family serine peptidase [Polyangiaceae bacterium]
MGDRRRTSAWAKAASRWLTMLAFAATLLAARRATANEVMLVPAPSGRIGAWLALGPITVKTKKGQQRSLDSNVLMDADEASLVGKLGRQVTVGSTEGDGDGNTASWKIINSSEGPIDIFAAMNPRGEAFAYLYGVLHLPTALKGGALLLGASDGARVWVDRKVVSSSDGNRPQRDDEDIARLDLPPGDHGILVKLHHRDGYWAFRMRVVDATFTAPRGAFFRLPATSDSDVRSLSAKMADIDINRGLSSAGFQPSVTVSFPEGILRTTDRAVRVTATARAGDRRRELFSVEGGEVPLSETGPSELKVQLPPIASEELGENEEGAELVMGVEVAGRKLESAAPVRAYMHQAVAAATRAIALCPTEPSNFLTEPGVTRATMVHLRDRFARYVNMGDKDLETLASDARTIVEYTADIEARRDPLRVHPGIRRFAYKSPLDGEPSPFGMYVPASYVDAHGARTKSYPLIVILHGLNGRPNSMMGHFFGHDDDNRDPEWEDRHPGEVEPIEAFVLSPNGHGNAMYRELGESDVVRAVDWAASFYPIDKNRITISGASMGGTGSASIAFRYPDRYAAAEPLCGYHSYLIRGDIVGRGLRSWEKLLVEQRSNTHWADNGLYMPLYIWHGRRDYPEKNSGVLIDRYKALGYNVEHEHPWIGHNVWTKAYEALGGYKWLSQQTRPEHKKRVLFKTNSLRYSDNAWVHLRDISGDVAFATIDAAVVDATQITVSTERVEAFLLDRDSELVSSTAPTRVTVDGVLLTYEPTQPIAAYRAGGTWVAGNKPESTGLQKRAGLAGPMRDAFFEPLVFVYGTQDPAQIRANKDTARAWARIKWGVDIRYPVVSDREYEDELGETHSLVLIGNSDSNQVVRDLESSLPFRVGSKSISAVHEGSTLKEWKGKDLGVAFIYPNPKHPSRYVLVLEGTSALGTFRAIALPELIPDYMVFDQRIAGARGQVVLGGAPTLAAGFFRRDWTLTKSDLNR